MIMSQLTAISKYGKGNMRRMKEFAHIGRKIILIVMFRSRSSPKGALLYYLHNLVWKGACIFINR